MSTVAPKAATTGEADASAASGKLIADRPMVIYVTSDDATNSMTRKLEDVGFKDERVGIGAKFFKCIKITGSNAAEDRLLKEHGKTSPRLLFVKRNYEVVAVLEKKKLSAGKIQKAMAKLCKAEYKDSFSGMLSKYAKLLNDLDRLDDVRNKLAADAKRLADGKKPSASKVKKYEKAKAAYEKQMEAWKASESKLLQFKAKDVKPARA